MADRWDRTVPPLSRDLLGRYLAFVGVERPAAPTLAALAELQTAHLYAIPFENISALIGESVSLAPEHIADKLLSGTRGGYCFEHNLLLAGALRALGYELDLLPGRVLLGATEPRPHTHLALRVYVEGRPILSDVGYGRTALRGPLELTFGMEQVLGADRFRVSDQEGEYLLELATPAGWEAQYLLDPRPAYIVDCEMGNHWVASHPKSTMKQRMMLLKPTPTGKRSIAGHRLVIADDDGALDQAITLDEIEAVLRQEFGIVLPAPLPYLDVADPELG